MAANHVASSPFVAFAPLVFRPVDRTVRMTSAWAQLAAQGKTLECARAEARARSAPACVGAVAHRGSVLGGDDAAAPRERERRS
jgi:hypothetical protein